MNLAETISEKVLHLPPKAQEEVLEIVEQIEERYHINDEPSLSNGSVLRALFGSVSLGHATGTDNESIDRDLELEYLKSHED